MKVFISYRHIDLDGHADALVGRIYDRLSTKYGKENVFMYVGSIPFGADFVEHIERQIAQSDVLVGVIGPQWAEQMNSRKTEGNDFVRIEFERALVKKIPVIPILVGNATMPSAAELPASLQRLSRLTALPVDTGLDFHSHVDRLIDALNLIPEVRTSRSRVAISGSRKNQRGDWEKFCRHLGYELAKQGFKILATHAQGIGKPFYDGAVDFLSSDGDQEIHSKCILAKVGDSDHAQRRKKRQNLLKGVDACVFVAGGDGTREEYEILSANGVLCVPVGASGGTAKGIWAELLEGGDSDLLVELGNENEKPEFYVTRIIQVLEKRLPH